MVGILLAATWVSVRSTNAYGGSGAVTVVHAVRGFVVGDGRALTDGDHLRVGDLIQVGADAKIRFDDRDALIDIVADSTLTIGDQGPELAHGALMISVEKQPPGTVFRVVTRHATITVIGTRFTVHADEQETRLSVAHGVVEMQTPRWTERFHAGQTASSLATGQPPTSIAASQPAASALSARLLDLATGQPVPGMDPLKPGALVPLNLFQAQRIAALEVLAPAEVMAVTIQVTGPSIGSDRKPLQRTRPFSYPNERGGKIDRTWELKPGVYQIQVHGFRDDQGTQPVGAALTLHFTVTAPE